MNILYVKPRELFRYISLYIQNRINNLCGYIETFKFRRSYIFDGLDRYSTKFFIVLNEETIRRERRNRTVAYTGLICNAPSIFKVTLERDTNYTDKYVIIFDNWDK